MAKFRKVHTSFWDDPLMEKLNPDARYFYLFLITNPLCTECGIYQISIKKMCSYTGYNEDSIMALIRIFEVENSRIVYDKTTQEMCLLKKANYIDRLGKPVLDCLKSEFIKVKNKSLIIRQINHTEKEDIRIVYKTIYDSLNLIRQEEEKEEEKEEEVEEVGSDIVKKVANEVWKDQSWKENMCIGLSLKMEELKKWLAMFNSSVATSKLKKFDNGVYMRMSRGWIVRQQEKGVKVETSNMAKTSDSAPLKRL